MTERSNAEAEQRAAQLQAAQFAGIINSAPDAIVGVDQADRIRLFNPAAQTMFGYTPWNALGKPLDLLIPERFRQAPHDEGDIGETGAMRYFLTPADRLTGLRADGTEFPVEATVSQVEVAGEKVYAIILREVTDREYRR